MKGKKGFLLGEETLKIIVAVICILLLVILLVALYSVFNKEKKLKEAKETLDEIKSAMDEGKKEVIIFKPTPDFTWYWWIIPWPDKDGFVADSCVSEGWRNCLCICKTNTFSTGFACTSSGVCIETSNIGYVEIPIRDVPVILNIEKTDGGFKITRITE